MPETDYSRYLARAISLARYAEIIQYGDCAFFGVSNENDPDYACRDIWTKPQRDDVAYYLLEAQHEIEKVIGYPAAPIWIENERRPYRCPIITKKSNLLEVGIKAEEILIDGASVSYATDPAIVSFATSLSSTEGVKVLYPEDQNIEITPSKMSISAGTFTIEIPKCRLVKYSKRNNPSVGLLYSDSNNFQEDVVVKRFYTDSSEQASLVWPHGCNQLCSANGCAKYTETACEVITNHEAGIMDLVAATYSGGSWKNTTRICCGGYPKYAELNYKAGADPLPETLEMAIIRLAHSKMPSEPCGCDVIHNLWARDSHVPQVLTRERLNNPFGLSDGAWMAWQFASDEAVIKMGVFA